METFRWDRHFETDLEAVDRQHHGLVERINRFGSLLDQGEGTDPRELERLFGELGRYAEYHFGEERRLMEEAGVDPRHMEVHAHAHASFREELEALRWEVGRGTPGGERLLLRFLIRWVAFHILGMDRAMAAQIKAIRAGASPGEAFEELRAEDDAARTPLLDSLNGLLELLSERNRQLRDMNRQLEARVADRTRELSEANRELGKANATLETLATTDVLTGLFNRRYAMDRLGSEIASARRHGEPLSLVLMDADDFKAVNDTYGHDAGDAALREIGAALKLGFRAGDVVCRLGGDEFLAICPRTPSAVAAQVGERVRLGLASRRIAAGGGEWRGSLSVGIASLETGAEELLKAADLALYEAKHLGRNRVVVHS